MSGTFSAALLGGLIAASSAGAIKFVGEHWLPTWMTSRRAHRLELERQLAHVRAPAIRALAELHDRLASIVSTKAHGHRYAEMIGEPNYFIDSTAYLIGRVFMWQETLRRQMAQQDHPHVYMVFESMTRAFANGRPGLQFLRLEQTEIGERLTAPTAAAPDCITYAEFLDWCRRDDAPRWLTNLRQRVRTLLDAPEAEYDRIVSIDRCLLAAVNTLDFRRRWRPLLTKGPVGQQAPAQPQPTLMSTAPGTAVAAIPAAAHRPLRDGLAQLDDQPAVRQGQG